MCFLSSSKFYDLKYRIIDKKIIFGREPFHNEASDKSVWSVLNHKFHKYNFWSLSVDYSDDQSDGRLGNSPSMGRKNKIRKNCHAF